MWHNLSQQQFYKGQSVSPEHLNQMQEYTDHTQCQTINSVFGKGVLYGFEVSHTADQIIISKGMGFDDRGRKLLLHEDKIIPLNEINISKHSLLKLGVQFCVIESDPIQDVTGTIINTKLTPSVEFVLGEELDAEILFLADIEITATEILSVKQKINFLPNYLNFAEIITGATKPTYKDDKTYAKGDILYLEPESYDEEVVGTEASNSSPFEGEYFGKPIFYQAETVRRRYALRVRSTKDNNTDDPRNSFGTSWVADSPSDVIETGVSSLGSYELQAGGLFRYGTAQSIAYTSNHYITVSQDLPIIASLSGVASVYLIARTSGGGVVGIGSFGVQNLKSVGSNFDSGVSNSSFSVQFSGITNWY